MALEDLTGNKYIDALDSANPVGTTDFVASVDDHLKGIKNVLKKSFPTIDGALTPTVAEINKLASLATTAVELGYVAGVTSALQAQMDLKAPLASPTLVTLTTTGLTSITDELRLLSQYTETAVSLGLGGALSCDLADGTYFYTGVLTSIPTFSFANLASGGLVSSGIIEMNNAFTYQPLWPAGGHWDTGIEPAWSTGRDYVGFMTRDGGTIISLNAIAIDSKAP